MSTSRSEALVEINRQKKSIRTQIARTLKALDDTARLFGDSAELQVERTDLLHLLELIDRPTTTPTEENDT